MRYLFLLLGQLRCETGFDSSFICEEAMTLHFFEETLAQSISQTRARRRTVVVQAIVVLEHGVQVLFPDLASHLNKPVH